MTSLGVLVHGFPRADGLGGIAQHIEALGYDSIWSGDHILSGVDGLVASAAFAAATDQIRVGTAVYLPHLRPTTAVGRMLATVEAAGGIGRFTFGVGAGGDVPAEFEVTGTDMSRRGALLDRCLDDLRTLFETDESFLDHGALPPVWTGGRAPRGLQRALRVGTGFAPYLVTVEQFDALARQVPAERSDFELAVNLLVAVDTPAETGAQAAQRAHPFGLPPELIARHVVTGSPSECAAQLGRYVERGAVHVIVNLAVTPARKYEQLAVIAEEILPALRAKSHAA